MIRICKNKNKNLMTLYIIHIRLQTTKKKLRLFKLLLSKAVSLVCCLVHYVTCSSRWCFLQELVCKCEQPRDSFGHSFTASMGVSYSSRGVRMHTCSRLYAVQPACGDWEPARELFGAKIPRLCRKIQFKRNLPFEWNFRQIRGDGSRSNVDFIDSKVIIIFYCDHP